MLPTLAVALVAVTSGVSVAAPPCDAEGADAAVVANARVRVEMTCNCAGASGVDTWRRCVRDALAPLVPGVVSEACERHVWRIERRSTCGRPERIVCCRTNSAGRTTATLRREGHCAAQPGGAACESEWAYLADGCTASGCAIVPPCGNGRIDPGETCDPPNGTTCNIACTSCAPEAGSILIGCTATPTGVVSAATADRLLVAYTDVNASRKSRALVKRLGNDGSIADALPLEASGLLPGTSASHGSTSAATSDGTGFYVAWESFADVFKYFGGRRVPASGRITAPPDVLDSHIAVGSPCGIFSAGPLNLAPTLDATSFHLTLRVIYACMGQILFENLIGVGADFTSMPPGLISRGPAPIVRGAHDVAAVWWGGLVDLGPPGGPPFVVTPFLAASWVEPGASTMIQLSSGTSAVAPALAALGDTFVAVWAGGSELRATRFTRASGALDPDGGVIVATGGAIGAVAAAANGSYVLAAWRESAGPGQSAIRAIRIAADGTVPDPTPIEVASSSADAGLSVAANSSVGLISFTRPEAVGSSVRAVLLDD